MTDLPRSRALVRLDGPGHIHPIEPVTPPGSTVWRVVHFPLILIIVAVALLAVAGYATNGFAYLVHQIGRFPGARLAVPAAGAITSLIAYGVFVRLVERRREMAEFGLRGALPEFAIAFVGGLALSSVVFWGIVAAGGLNVLGYGRPETLIFPVLYALCAAVIQEIILRGLFFRLLERMIGSWLALVASAALLGVAHLVNPSPNLLSGLAIVLEAGLMFSALYMVTRRLWAAIGLHAAWNFAQASLYGAASATQPPGLVLTHDSGPEWLTGGAFGTDTSLVGVVINSLFLLALLGVAIWRGRIVRPSWSRGRIA